MTMSERVTQSEHAGGPRLLGAYVLRTARGGPEMVTTPAGYMPVAELSALFSTQIAPLEYFPEVPRAEDAVDIAIVDNRKLDINGQPVELRGEHLLFAWNALLALRNAKRVRLAEAVALGVSHGYHIAKDSWSTTATALAKRVNEAAGTPLLHRAAAADTGELGFYADPRLHLIDRRPAAGSMDHFEQTLPTRLLSLPDPERLAVRYGAPALELTITTNRQVERGGLAWVLSRDERYLLNLIRLAKGQPLLLPEILTTGCMSNRANIADRRAGIHETAAALNTSIFSDDGMPALVFDKTLPAVLRLAREVTITDERYMPTPTRSEADDSGAERQLASVLEAYSEDYRQRHGVYAYPALKSSLAPRPEHIALVREHAADTFMKQQLTLRDMYVISLRTGLHLPFLKHSVLPAPDGRRIAYNDLEQAIRLAPMHMAEIGRMIGVEWPSCNALFTAAITRIKDAL